MLLQCEVKEIKVRHELKAIMTTKDTERGEGKTNKEITVSLPNC